MEYAWKLFRLRIFIWSKNWPAYFVTYNRFDPDKIYNSLFIYNKSISDKNNIGYDSKQSSELNLG